MKHAVIIIAVLCLAGCQTEPKIVYDPNHAIYKFIPLADKSWVDMFGDTDDTRMKHSLSELRVVVAAQGNLIKAHEDRLKVLETTNELGVSATAELTTSPVTSIADPNTVYPKVK